MMEEKKIQLTREFVIKNFKRTFLYKCFTIHLFELFIIIIFLVICCFLEHYSLLKHPYTFVWSGLYLPIVILCVYEIFKSTWIFVRVLCGDFYIVSDKLLRYGWRGRTNEIMFIFERYGVFIIKRVYSFIRKRVVSPREQCYEAYNGDIYYIVVFKKTQTIAAIYNSKYYEYEHITAS